MTTAPSREPGSDRVAGLEKLKSKLEMDIDPEVLGIQEKSFDSCKLGFHEAGGKCGPRFFTVVNFRIRCRDSEDTVSEVPADLLGLMASNIAWTLGSQKGKTSTDGEGFGKIVAVSPASLKGERLVLVAGKQFLGVDVTNESSEMVVPMYWCTPR